MHVKSYTSLAVAITHAGHQAAQKYADFRSRRGPLARAIPSFPDWGHSIAALIIVLGLTLTGAFPAFADADNREEASWLPSLITDTSEEGFALAVKLSQKGVATTQPDAAIRKRLRPEYAENAGSLISASQVIAIHFRTIAEANDYWR